MTTDELYEKIYGNTAAAVAPKVEEPVQPEKPKVKKKKKAPKQDDGWKIGWREGKIVIAAVLFVLIGITYLHACTEIRQLKKEIATNKSTLKSLQVMNADLESELLDDMDLNTIKKLAISRLGMKKPDESHIIQYSNEDDDYIRQYGSIEEE